MKIIVFVDLIGGMQVISCSELGVNNIELRGNEISETSIKMTLNDVLTHFTEKQLEELEVDVINRVPSEDDQRKSTAEQGKTKHQVKSS